MRVLKIFFSCFLLWQGFMVANSITSKYNLQIKKSNKSFEDTYSSVIKFLEEKKINIFAQIDHAKNAQDVSLKLNPTKVVIFGNPKVGTHLMVENQALGIDLPVKVAVWQNDKGEVYAAFVDFNFIAKTYGLKNEKIIKGTQDLLTNILNTATK